MSDYVKIAKVSEIPNGEMRGRKVGDTPVVLANVGGQFFALSDICTHEHCELHGGYMEGTDIVCPCHGSQFDAKTGKVDNLPATEDLKTLEVKVKDGEIFVKVN